jgi:rhamnose utilization protein RhaD (predicted bifunctional aldolase and dehydrogenase)
MKNLWDDKESRKFKTDLELRVYTSRLLGQDSSLVLHGGGNTSVKSNVTNLFGKNEEIIYVKGSGWDLATIQEEGFSPVKMTTLLEMAKLPKLNDTDMVKYQRMAMINPSAPNPSVEAILHAIIPFKFVDHTHADDIITISNTKNGKDKIEEIYGDTIIVIPYIMPGFELAKLVYEMTKETNWDKVDGMILLNHGLFTFDNDAKKSYSKTIDLVNKAKDYLKSKNANIDIKDIDKNIDLFLLAKIRNEISKLKGCATISTLNDNDLAIYFSNQDIKHISQKAPLTPDHVIRTKRVPAILTTNFKEELSNFKREYEEYFNANMSNQTILNKAPNFAILKNIGILSFGKNLKEATIIKDINHHTNSAILKAQMLGGYEPLDKKDIFEVEYWELEQAKINKSNKKPKLEGKVAIVLNALDTLNIEIINSLNKDGAIVIAVDSNRDIKRAFNTKDIIGIELSKECGVDEIINLAIKSFGGIDIIIGNLEYELVDKIIPFLTLGVESTIISLSDTNQKLQKLINDNNINYSKINTNNLKINQYKSVANIISDIAQGECNYDIKTISI